MIKMDGHSLSVFTNRSVTAPYTPRIKTKKTFRASSLSVCSPEVRTNLSGDCTDVEQLLQSNIALREEVQQCREEYQDTIATMQALHAAHTGLCSAVPDRAVATEHPLVTDSTCDRKVPLNTHSSMNDSQDVDNGMCGFVVTTVQQPCSNAVTSTALGDMKDPFASPGMELIEQMWENFSVDSYTAHSGRGWRPSITVPQPFSMTLRESQEPRKKSRSMIMAEKERAEMAARVEAEMKRQFRATPVPATTFLPLYTLVCAKNAKSRPRSSSYQRPVGRAETRPYSADCTERSSMFKARPIPKGILSCEMTERIKCEEEYRKIRIKVRAQNLAASSQLPFTTHSRSRQHSAPSHINLKQEKLYQRLGEKVKNTRTNHTKETTQGAVNKSTPLSDMKKYSPPWSLSSTLHRREHSEVKSPCTYRGVMVEEVSMAPRTFYLSPYPAPITRSVKLQRNATRKRLK